MKQPRVLTIKATLLQRAAKFLGKEKLAVRLISRWPRLSVILSKEADQTRGPS
jgi:hypothetical protein